MLKANELRIGNWIADRGLKEWQIDHWETMNKVSAKPNIMMCSGILMETHPLTEYVDYLKPIPLTEEWFLRFGFEKYEFDNGEPNQYRYKSRLIVIRDGKFADYGSSVILHYVHQLQNFYFAFSSEELVLQD